MRQSERHLHHDPPHPDELAALARRRPRDVRGGDPAGAAQRGRRDDRGRRDGDVDGRDRPGAATPYDPARVHGYHVTLAACRAIGARLAAIPEDERRRTPGLHPDRAPRSSPARSSSPRRCAPSASTQAEVSEHDILYGVAIDAAGTDAGTRSARSRKPPGGGFLKSSPQNGQGYVSAGPCGEYPRRSRAAVKLADRRARRSGQVRLARVDDVGILEHVHERRDVGRRTRARARGAARPACGRARRGSRAPRTSWS